MEGGQKIDINLESPIDTKSSDMLVSVNDVKFAHNWQKYQGHVLPTSLRYESNGWAAGWYVYDFKVGGGIIFSGRSTNPDLPKAPYLAVSRTKISNNPTYIMSYKVATNNDPSDVDAVKSATQFRTWYNSDAAIAARECKEASIDSSNVMQPVLSFDYAIDGVSHKRQIKYNYAVDSNGNIGPTATPFTPLSNTYGNANLTMDYVDIDQHGTIHAILYNNDVAWTGTYNVNVPKDIPLNSDGDIFAQFDYVDNQGVVYYNVKALGIEDGLYYSLDAYHAASGSGITINSSNVASVQYPMSFDMIVPLNKNYISFNNIAYAIQGSNILFSQLDKDNPFNKYYIDSMVAVTDVPFYNQSYPGPSNPITYRAPDISLLSALSVEMRLLAWSGRPAAITAAQHDALVNMYNAVVAMNSEFNVPIFNSGVMPGFKMPGSDISHNVIMQVYLKYNGEYVEVGRLNNRSLFMCAYMFYYGMYNGLLPPIYVDEMNTVGAYKIDNKQYTAAPSPYSADQLHNVLNFSDIDDSIPSIDITKNVAAGRYLECEFNIAGINGLEYDEPIPIKFGAINTNLIFSNRVATMDTVQESAQGYSVGDADKWGGTAGGGPYTSAYVYTTMMTWGDYPDDDVYLRNKVTNSNVLQGLLGTYPDLDYTTRDIKGAYLRYQTALFDADERTRPFIPILRLPTLDPDRFVVLFSSNGFGTAGDLTINSTYHFIDNGASAGTPGHLLAVEDTDDLFTYDDPDNITKIYIKNGNAFSVQDYKFTYFQFNLIPSTLVKYQSGGQLSRWGTNPFNYEFLCCTSYEGDNGHVWARVSTLYLTKSIYGDYFVYAGRNIKTVAGDPIWDWDTTGQYGFPIWAPEYVVGQGNQVGIRLRTTTGVWYKDITIDDHWVTYSAVDRDSVMEIAPEQLNNSFSFDVVDADTGEVLIDHRKDRLLVNDTSKIDFYFDEDHAFCGNTVNMEPVNDTTHFTQYLSSSSYKASLHKVSNIGRAFFPFVKNTTYSTAYITSATYGTFSGVTLFNLSKYSTEGLKVPDLVYTLLSPLTSYVLPPAIKDDTFTVYAKRTYTNKVSIKVNNSRLDIGSYYIYYINDNFTDLSNITVIPVTLSYTDNDCETNNKYYKQDALLKPASITYYNNKLNLTFGVATGQDISIDNISYDLSTADLSIKQVADLGLMYLAKYYGTGSGTPDSNWDAYNITLADSLSSFNTDEVKVVKQHINDTSLTRGYMSVQGAAITNDDYGIAHCSITYNVWMYVYPYIESTQAVLSNPMITPVDLNNAPETEYRPQGDQQQWTYIRDYTSESQLVIRQYYKATTSVQLPMDHAGSYGEIDRAHTYSKIVQSADTTYAKYSYSDNRILEMKINGSQVTRAQATLNSVTEHNAYTNYSVLINQAVNTDVYFRYSGIYKIAYYEFGDTEPRVKPKVESISYNNGVFSIRTSVVDLSGMTASSIGPATYTVNFSDFESDDPAVCTPKYLEYYAKDVRKPNTQEPKKFAKVLCDNEYQLIKQQWNSTIEVENYWWLDSEHILLLTKDQFIVKEKQIDGGFDDWNGDNWEVLASYPRTDYLNSEEDTLLCSSVKGDDHAYLYIIKPDTLNTLIVDVYDPFNGMEIDYSCYLEFKHVPLYTQLEDSVSSLNNLFTLATYSDILATSVIVDTKFTAVEINGRHWLGIQYDKNLNQWSLCLSSDTASIVHGYGCIGINGYATGGMLPDKYVEASGSNIEFTGVVCDIDDLEAEEDTNVDELSKFNKFNERIVGDENQQWYISESLTGIVMAVNLDTLNKIVLPLSNTYSQVYSSPSYAKYTVHAFGLQIKQLIDLFDTKQTAQWTQIIKYAMFPVVMYLSPYTNVINYLQQTLGQYAYVHYNSTSNGKRKSFTANDQTTDNAGLTEDESTKHIDALTMDDLSFDVQHIAQEQSFKDSSWDNMLGIFMSMVISATDYSIASMSVNSLQNQTAVSDIGRKFSQAFSQNIASMSVTGFNMQSTKPMLKSEVTAVKTLDMFYSTSADQKCFAGPGYVNMQFVAQCTAQSVTSVQLEAQQTQVFLLLKELSTFQAKAEIFLIDELANFLFKQADQQASGPEFGFSNAVGFIISLVLSSTAYALTAAKAMLRLSTELIDSMLDSLFPNGLQSNVTATLSRHNYDIEGKHAYGNKSEQFFWPCIDCNSKLYTDEKVSAILQKKPWPLEMPQTATGNVQTKKIYDNQPRCTTIKPAALIDDNWNIDVDYNIASCKGTHVKSSLPNDTAYVVGTESFLPTVPFKNENIGEGEPVFTPSVIQDYVVDKNWNIFVTAMGGDELWVSCKDTKLFDGGYSNIIVSDTFCGIAAPHVAIEVKSSITEEYLRPWAVTPDAIALNVTGLNCAYEEYAYHAFDGYGYRITDWLGSSGMNKEHYTLQYCFQINDRFKRSNKLPPNQFMGNFQAVPNMSLDVKDKIFNQIQVTSEEQGMETGVIGENKDQQRYSLPIFTEPVSTLPAIVKAQSSYKLDVIEGITALTTDVRSSQTAYKLPVSVDFNINEQQFRMTNEYICSVKHEKGLEQVQYLVPALGLKYLGATPFMAYFYNQATRQYYIYQGGNTLQAVDMLERFRDITEGRYDFVSQEVIMPCLATLSRIDDNIKDDADETDNIIVPTFKHNKINGEIIPPITTIFNTRSWYKTLSTPAGVVFQGPNRCIINRYVWSDYMLADIKSNKKQWVKVPREEYHPFRKYTQKYDNVTQRLDIALNGWTHNQFLLVTSPLGINEQTDCKFEWEITFAWTVEMEQLYEQNEYVTVNIMAETMEPGGKVFSRPTHIFLTKELFARSNNYGYYSFRYQSNNGIGNRERLHIWSDGYIAISGIQLEYLAKTEKRNEILTIQEDVKGMKEM